MQVCPRWVLDKCLYFQHLPSRLYYEVSVEKRATKVLKNHESNIICVVI